MSDAPDYIKDFEALVAEINSSGVAPITKFKLNTKEDYAQAILAYVGLLHGRNVAMLEATVGDTPLVEPAKGVIFAKRISDKEYIFVDDFDQLKSTVYAILTKGPR